MSGIVTAEDEIPMLQTKTQTHPHAHPLKKWKPFLAEFVGTFVFAFVTETAAVATSKASQEENMLAGIIIGALVNGFTLVGVIYSLGPVSGAHFNPAVTVAAMCARQLSPTKALGYIISQILGGLLGTSWVLLVHPDAEHAKNGALGLFVLSDSINWVRGFFVEAVMTFILVFVIFCVVLNPHVTVEDATNGHIAPLFAPIAVGFTVTANILGANGLTGGCMNPARALGPIIITNTWRNAQVYILGPLIGGIAASVFQRIVFGKDPYFNNF